MNYSNSLERGKQAAVAELQSVERGIFPGRLKSRAVLRAGCRRYALPASPGLLGDAARFRRYVREALGLEIRTGGDWWERVVGVVR